MAELGLNNSLIIAEDMLLILTMVSSSVRSWTLAPQQWCTRHNWAWAAFKDTGATGYELSIRVDDMDAIDMSALKLHLSRSELLPRMGWICPCTCIPGGHAFEYITIDLLGQRASMLFHRWTSCVCCLYKAPPQISYLCHRLPRDEGTLEEFQAAEGVQTMRVRNIR